MTADALARAGRFAGIDVEARSGGRHERSEPPFTGAYADLDRLERALLALIVAAAEDHPEGPERLATLTLVEGGR